jgi:CubicO group peptidase (beta-lactamase class C family)
MIYLNMLLIIALSQANVFPEESWQESTPESQDIDSEKLKLAMDYLQNELKDCGGIDTAVIIRNGYLIWKGKDSDEEVLLFSATKSFTSTVLGLLIDDGKVTLDTYAKDYSADLVDLYPDVKIRHFATMTSGYDVKIEGGYEADSKGRTDSWNPEPPSEPLFPPGTMFRYWDEAMMQFGKVLTAIAGESLKDIFKRRIADSIGMTKWKWQPHDSPNGRILNWTGGIRTNSLDLARFGHLFLNKGNWNGKQLVSESWVNMATTVQVPNSIPNDEVARSRGSGIYGFNWWVNGIKPDGHRMWDNAPPRTYFANGLHNNVCIIIPEWNMVIARTNKNGSPSDIDKVMDGFFGLLNDAIK